MSRLPPHEFVIPAILLVVAIIALLVGLPEPINVYDEGIAVYGAQRILAGDAPYADFWTLYAPGQYWIVAGLFNLFGSSILVERLWDTLVRAGVAVLIFLLTRRLAAAGPALAVWAISVLWLVHFGHFGYAVFPALLLTLLGFLGLMRAVTGRHRAPWSIVSGVSLGLATWFRHDLGLYALVSALIALILVRLVPAHRGSDETRQASPGILAMFTLGAGLVLLPAALNLSISSSREAIVQDLLIVPATIFPTVRALPYPAPHFSVAMSPVAYLREIVEIAPFYLPPATYVVGLIVIVRRLARGERDAETLLPLVLLVAFGIMSFNQARIRGDLAHLAPTLIPACVLMAAWCRNFPPAKRGFQGALTTWVGLGVYGLLLIQPAHGYAMKASRLIVTRSPRTQDVPRASGIRLDADQARAIEFIQRHVPPGASIFVGNDRHDRLVINDVALYFLAERASATRYHELHPGIATSAPVQREIVTDLERNGVQYVVRVSGLGNPNEPNGSSRSSGVRILDDYLGSKYQPAETFGRYTVLRRR